MKKGFVQTENFKRLREAEKLVAKRGAREAGLVIVRGVYGIGKSELTERWAVDSGSWFCNEAVGASVGLVTPECFDPAQFSAIALTFGREVTSEFFATQHRERRSRQELHARAQLV